MAGSIKWEEEADTELPLEKQVLHSGSWEDEGVVRNKYAVELDLNGLVKVEMLEGEAQGATTGESTGELAVTPELVSNGLITTMDPLFYINCYRKRLSQSRWNCLQKRYVHNKLVFMRLILEI
jgi:hypothetical protein